jgi:hypothetical protein
MRHLGLVLAGILVGGCSDPQRAGFEQCEALESRGDLAAALKACREAAGKDRTTRYGELAYAKANRLGDTLQASLEAKARDQEEREVKWAADLKAGKIPPGTPAPGSSPKGTCNCTPGDPLCSCL